MKLCSSCQIEFPDAVIECSKCRTELTVGYSRGPWLPLSLGALVFAIAIFLPARYRLWLRVLTVIALAAKLRNRFNWR